MNKLLYSILGVLIVTLAVTFLTLCSGCREDKPPTITIPLSERDADKERIQELENSLELMRVDLSVLNDSLGYTTAKLNKERLQRRTERTELFNEIDRLKIESTLSLSEILEANSTELLIRVKTTIDSLILSNEDIKFR